MHELGKEATENPGRPLFAVRRSEAKPRRAAVEALSAFAAAMCITTVLVGVGLAGADDTVASSEATAAKVDKHALPLGDGKVTTSGPKRGWIYACRTSSDPAGAFTDGPWIKDDGTYDITEKVTVDGAVEWPQATQRQGGTSSSRACTTTTRARLPDAEQVPQAKLVGFALDGFPIYNGRDEDGKRLTNADLDKCHGRTSVVKLDGEKVKTYHYEATLEYPYTLGCFRGTPVA